jgi:hypothetical protein
MYTFPGHHIAKDTVCVFPLLLNFPAQTSPSYATQSILGDAAAVGSNLFTLQTALKPQKVYRCWILWSKDYRIVIFPCLLLIGEIGIFRQGEFELSSYNKLIVSGYMVCGLYSTFNPAVSDFDAPLTSWITAWYVIAVRIHIGRSTGTP